MKLKTQFILGAAILGVILVAMAVFVAVTRVQLAALNSQHEIANNLQQEANDLAYFSNNYLLYREPEQKARWETVFASFQNDASRLTRDNPQEAALIDDIGADSRRLGQVFQDVAAALTATGNGRSQDGPFLQVSWSRMEVQNREILSSAARLERSLETRADRANLVSQAVIIAMMVAFGLILLAGYFVTYRRTISGISELNTATNVVATGDLAYLINTDRRDEIGQLSQAFNRMTTDLGNVTASKTELEKEIEHRRHAEAEREQLLVQAGELAHSLAISNELLRAQNEELAAREEELAAQNEELAVREEELLAQNEELRVAEERTARLLAERNDLFRQLQSGLVHIPSEIPGIAFGHLYRSATKDAEVGGDFYDIFETEDGQVAILIGDVSGNGIEAARIANVVKDTVHAFAHQSDRPNDVLRQTNQLLVRKGIPGFVTAFLGFLDRRAGVLRYSSAGHPPPLLITDSRPAFLESVGVPLGVFADTSYRELDTALPRDSVLLLYTDGVTDVRRDSSLFGEEGLMDSIASVAALNVTTLPSIVLADALRFSGQTLGDDVALMAVSLSTGTAS